jgi:hypothetical protein
MPIATFPVPLVSDAHAQESLARHIDRNREAWEFASDDIQEPITFGTILTLDTLAPVIVAFSRADLTLDRALASGWSYRRIDLGDRNRVDIVFTAPGNQNEGFVFRMKPSSYFADEIQTVSAYLFTDRKFWYPSSRKAVVDALKSGKSRPSAFEYDPQYVSNMDGRSLKAHSSSKPFDPESVLKVLPPLVEALSSFDPGLFATSVASNSTATYQTLFKENQDVLIATRNIMTTGGHLAVSGLDRLVNFLWQTGMSFDVNERLGDVDALAKLLVDQGNTSKRTEYDFDDDKCGAYVKIDGAKTTVYFRHEKDAIAVSRSGDRLVISAADFKSGETFETYVDLEVEGGKVTKSFEATPLRSHVTSLLRRWVHEIEGLGEEMDETPAASPVAPSP